MRSVKLIFAIAMIIQSCTPQANAPVSTELSGFYFEVHATHATWWPWWSPKDDTLRIADPPANTSYITLTQSTTSPSSLNIWLEDTLKGISLHVSGLSDGVLQNSIGNYWFGTYNSNTSANAELNIYMAQLKTDPNIYSTYYSDLSVSAFPVRNCGFIKINSVNRNVVEGSYDIAFSAGNVYHVAGVFRLPLKTELQYDQIELFKLKGSANFFLDNRDGLFGPGVQGLVSYGTYPDSANLKIAKGRPFEPDSVIYLQRGVSGSVDGPNGWNAAKFSYLGPPYAVTIPGFPDVRAYVRDSAEVKAFRLGYRSTPGLPLDIKGNGYISRDSIVLYYSTYYRGYYKVSVLRGKRVPHL